MTSQMQGEILFDGWSGTGDGDWVYTPWMPVRGNYAMFGVQMLANEGGITLGWEVQRAQPSILRRSSLLRP